MPSHLPDTLSLLADIGGTNTRVALARGARVLPETLARYANADYPGLGPLLAHYIAAQGNVDCQGACVAAAGPVADGKAELTNLDWVIDEATIAEATRAETVALLNDLQAQGHALAHIGAQSLIPILAGPALPRSTARLVVGIGTGMNAAVAHPAPPGHPIVPPSECGHTTAPAKSEADLRLMRFSGVQGALADVEEILSGRGLEKIDAWLATEAGTPASRTAAEIVAAIATGHDARATRTGEVFATFLGRVCGDLALIHLPYGGVFLIGGVVRALAPHLIRFGFETAFRDKGRFAGIMDSFAVHVVTDDFAALTGSAVYLDARMRGAGRE